MGAVVTYKTNTPSPWQPDHSGVHLASQDYNWTRSSKEGIFKDGKVKLAFSGTLQLWDL